MAYEMGQSSLDDILITDQLSSRLSRTPDLKAENDALRTLARHLVEQPQTMLKTLVNLAKDLCRAGTAGVSLLETTPNGKALFRWVAITGELEPHEQATVPYDLSPCGICLERQSPQLYAHPERYFTDLQGSEPPIVEGLVVPLIAANQPLGAIWILSHDPQRQFDAEDVRVMTSLADFTAAALYNRQIRQTAESAQAELRQQEAKLSLVTNAVPVLISFIDSEKCYRFNNRTYEEWFGHLAADVYGKPMWEVLGEAAYQTIHPYVEQVLAGQQVTFESEVPYQDGGTRYVQATYIPRFNSQGNVEGFVALVSDISERKQTEVALRQSDRRFKSVFNQQFQYMAILTPEGRIIDVNESPLNSTGVKREEVVGQLFWETPWWTPLPDIQAMWMTHVAQAMQGGDPITGETYYATGDGTLRFSQYVLTAVKDETDQVVNLIIQASDLTDRKQAEETLRASEERLRIAQQAAKAGVWDWDIATNRVTWSEAYYQIYGLDSAITPPSYENWLASIAPSDRDRTDRSAREALENQTNLNAEFRIFHPSQGERWITAIGQTFYDANQQPIRMTGIALDITARKQAEAALSQSEFRFQTLVKNIPGMVYRYIPEAEAEDSLETRRDRFTYVSSGCRNLFELEPETVLENANALWALVHPDDLPSLQSSIAAAVANSVDWQWEGRAITPSGQLKWIQGKSRIEETEHGKVWDGLLIDISDRKRAEEALAQSEAQLRLIIESAKDYAILTLDMNGFVTHWNSGAQRLLGYQDNEILGQDGRIIFTPEDLERGKAEEEMHKALHEGQAENERWHVRKDRTRFWGSGLAMPLRNEENQVQGFLKILQDRTSQRQADEQLRLLYEMTSDLLATEKPLALMNTLFSKLSAQLDLHYYYNFLIEEKGNQQKLHLTNYGGISEALVSQIEWVNFGQHICGLVAQGQQQIVLDQTQIATRPDAAFIRSAGITAYACQPLIAQGRLLGTLSFASLTRTGFTPEEVNLLQVTCAQIAIAIERANLTTSLQQQTEQLQQANRIKDEFLAVLSHELRSPLNPILGWAKLLQTGSLDEARTKQALTTIERNAKLQSELIEDLLDVSRILQGKLSLNMVPVDLVSTIQAAMETVRLAAEARSIQIQTELDDSTGKILGDSARIQQVIWNLLSNAVKFTSEGGRVDIQLKQVGNRESGIGNRAKPDHSLPPTPHSSTHAQIIVSDTGKGISPDFLPHVFDYFRQEDGATTRKFGGLGLGLAIVRHLVELHGGTIEADSLGEGQGATFTVQLPLLGSRESGVGSRDKVDSPLSTAHSPLTGLRILVADDDADTREYIAFLLEQTGARVTAVASASEAFALLTQSKPDLLLSDIGMPDMDGYMLLRQVRTLPPEQGGNIPAIALTAYAGEINQQQAIAAGFQHHLSKPVEPAELVTTIVSLMG